MDALIRLEQVTRRYDSDAAPTVDDPEGHVVGLSRGSRAVTTSIRTDHITDDDMHNRISQTKTYTLMVLKPTPEYFAAGSRPIVWEHGRRNMALQAAGIMPIVCPVGDDRISGIGIFDTDPAEARSIMAGDPGVRAGIFTFEVHACRGFPGDALPS